MSVSVAPKVPEGYEKCEVVTGCTLLLANGLEVRYCDSESARGWYWSNEGTIRMRLSAQSASFELNLPVEALVELGITPIRQALPLEFTVERIEISSGRLCLLVSIDGRQLDRPTADRMIGLRFRQEEDQKIFGETQSLNKTPEIPAKPVPPLNKKAEPAPTVVVAKVPPVVATGQLNGAKKDSEMPPGWAPSAVVVKSGPKGATVTPDEHISISSQIASQLQSSWEGVLAESPRVPRPKTSTWKANYTPEEYVAGLIELALTSKSERFPASSLAHIRDSDGELIGYILLLDKRLGAAQRERFCTDLLIQQKARAM